MEKEKRYKNDKEDGPERARPPSVFVLSRPLLLQCIGPRRGQIREQFLHPEGPGGVHHDDEVGLQPVDVVHHNVLIAVELPGIHGHHFPAGHGQEGGQAAAEGVAEDQDTFAVGEILVYSPGQKVVPPSIDGIGVVVIEVHMGQPFRTKGPSRLRPMMGTE